MPRAIALPPGTNTLFDVGIDAQGNEYYFGNQILFNALTLEAYPTPVDPVYATPPVARTTVSVDTSTPGGRSINITVKEGVRLRDSAPQGIAISPSVIDGWRGGESVRILDGVNADTDAPASVYCDSLELSQFDTRQIPVDAIITGIRVTVVRSKI